MLTCCGFQIEKNKNLKEKKRLRKLADPNADLNAGFSQDIFGETDYYFENGEMSQPACCSLSLNLCDNKSISTNFWHIY